MRAIWLEDRKVSSVEVPIPTPPPGEALVAVRLAGVCATDLELIKGYYPYAGILGHEFVGEVVAAHDRPDLEGARVVGEINAVCGACDQRRKERSERRPLTSTSGTPRLRSSMIALGQISDSAKSARFGRQWSRKRLT